MSTYVCGLLSLILAVGWWMDHRRQEKALSERDRWERREMTEILPDVTQAAWLTTYSTLFSISAHPPFVDENADHSWGTQFSDLGESYREALHESQRRWFKKMDSENMTPLVFGKEALSAFDEVLARYSVEIDQAHEAMMKYYQGRPMPVRNQDGFNWVRLW